MSLQEIQASMGSSSSHLPFNPKPEALSQSGVSPTQCLDLANLEHCNAHIALDETNAQLLYSKICHRAEAQSRQILQNGLEALQQTYFQLLQKYKSACEEYDRLVTRLREDAGLSEELIQSQKQMIDIYQDQQQQSASHVAQAETLLPQYNEHSQIPSYQPLRSHEFILDPTGFTTPEDFAYNLGPSTGGCSNLEPIQATEFEPQIPNMSIQSIMHTIPTTGDFAVPTHGSEGTRIVPGDEGARPSKKRKTK